MSFTTWLRSRYVPVEELSLQRRTRSWPAVPLLLRTPVVPVPVKALLLSLPTFRLTSFVDLMRPLFSFAGRVYKEGLRKLVRLLDFRVACCLGL